MHTTAKAFRAWRTFAALTVLTATALLMFQRHGGRTAVARPDRRRRESVAEQVPERTREGGFSGINP